MVTIFRTCPFTGTLHEMTLPLSGVEYEAAFERWQSGVLIQNAFPTLDAGQREFIKTGITPQEWDNLFGPDEEND